MTLSRLIHRRLHQALLRSAVYFKHFRFVDARAVSIDVRYRHLIESWQKMKTMWAHDLSDAEWPDLTVLDGILNDNVDVLSILKLIPLKRHDRLGIVLYSPYLVQIKRWIRRDSQGAFITQTILSDILKLSGLELVRREKVRILFFPMLWICYLRRSPRPSSSSLSLSVIVPAKNEAGNIPRFFQDYPDSLKSRSEIIFVSGPSTDSTEVDIDSHIQAHQSSFSRLTHIRQSGHSKQDAVREGHEKAQHEVVTILDADLTVPAKDLCRFVDAYQDEYADFINGTRLVYPIEGNEMRLINKFGNIVFAKWLGSLFNMPISDTMCGTKLYRRIDLDRFTLWKRLHPAQDPFGDFDLLFAMAQLQIGCINLPIAYKKRTYGSTNIFRFRHGLQLIIYIYRIRFSKK